MRVSEENIHRFLDGIAGEQEQAAVRRYFTEHPEELERYMTEESWARFRATGQLAVAHSDKMLETIGSHTWQRRRPLAVVLLRAAVAVVLLLAAGAGFLLLRGKPEKKVLTAEENKIRTEERVNNTGRVLTVTLPDNTVADIQPGGKLQYRLPFGAEDRVVHLSGQALFHVKSNAGKPFTVFAGHLGTTALGTVFSVKAGQGKVVVRLMSGKVMVRNTASDHAPVYLKPGEQLYYDEVKQTVSVEQPAAKPQRAAPVAVAPVVPEAPAVTVLAFENEPLAALFKTIETQFGMQVRYGPGVLDNMYFTGVYDGGKESLADFLNTIALLNNINIRISDKQIYITP